HDVTALDRDEDLLAALHERAGAANTGGSPSGKLTVVCADARALGSLATDPVGGGFGLCIAAMQTLQLFGGPAGRADFLRGARDRSIELLDRLDAATLATEATAAGLRVLAPRTVPETGDHIASTVVMLGA